MPWYGSVTLADSESLTAGQPVEHTYSTDGDRHHTPVVCIALEDLEGNGDDTVTVRFEGAAATYVADQRTLSEVGSYTVDIPQCEAVQVTSSNGVTYSIEVRNNPR
jgi:hypothetical protein